MQWFLVILFGAFSVFLLSGHGAFLIAGYNTAGKARKMCYDEKKLCRVIGGGMGIITILLAALAASGDRPPAGLLRFFPILTLITVVVMLILANTICKKKDVEVLQETEADKKARKKTERNAWIFCGVTFLLVGILLVSGDIKIKVLPDSVEMDGFFWSDYTVKTEDIETVSFMEEMDAGSRTNGFGSFKLLQGNFRNKSFGDYTLYAYTKCKSYVVLKTTKGVVAINEETPEATRALYEKIEQSVK